MRKHIRFQNLPSRFFCAFLFLFGCAGMAVADHHTKPAARPNVILVITDDQGYGDVGALGNTMIKTPHLDALHGRSVRLTDYHVDPTCSPTRSALMSGRYSTRTGVWHTILGRSLMRTGEVTVAEAFRDSGYRTGMFGKWHLGDNYPLRPQDQGFQDVVCHGGGGVGQGPDYWGNDYFDDTYWRNGKPEKFEGYCTDVWFREAMRFIREAKDRPFFCYLSTNAPHGPYLVDPKFSQAYADAGVPATMAKFYGMIANIDENMGKLEGLMKELDLVENTILVFTTDNGTAAGVARSRRGRTVGNEAAAWRGFNAGMRGAKGSEYDGGHRVPFFVHWPGGGLEGGRDVGKLCAHIDVLPTLADMCGLIKAPGPDLDGISLRPWLEGNPPQGLPNNGRRTLFVHSQRILHPEKWRKSAVMTRRWRLVNGKELYDIRQDPGQENDLAEEKPRVAKRLQRAYERWWKSLEPVFPLDVAIAVGSPQESSTELHAHDWQMDSGPCPWSQGHIRNGVFGNGEWVLDVLRDGTYDIELRRWPKHVDESLEATEARLQVGGHDEKQAVESGATSARFTLDLKSGRTRMKTILRQEPDGKERGAYYVYVQRRR